MATVSVCMIVKNEEMLLERCLGCLCRIADEIILVDTGSTDSTKSIAGKYTDKIFDFVWTGDFAQARNFAFSKASMEYIYSADADEILDVKNQERFLTLKEAILPEIDIVQMKYCNQLMHNTVYNFDEEYRPKLFRRLRTFRWIDPIHEMVALEPVIFDSDIEIIHMPVGSHAKRDLELFLRMHETGEPISTRLHSMYAKELFITGDVSDLKKAVSFFKDSIRDEGRTQDELKEASCVLARSARLEGDIHSFFTYAMKNIVLGSCTEICYELGEYYFARGEYEESVIWYYNGAYETECILNLELKKGCITGLEKCYRMVGDVQKASEYKKMAEDEKSTCFFG